MDEDRIKLLATIAAMQLLLGKLYALVYELYKLTLEQVLAAHKMLRERVPEWNLINSDDPAISDLLSSEIENVIDLFLTGVEKEIGARPKEP